MTDTMAGSYMAAVDVMGTTVAVLEREIAMFGGTTPVPVGTWPVEMRPVEKRA